MKAVLALGISLLIAAPAAADELLVGAVRDQDGSVVAGARVTALDSTGKTLASDRTAADGTFAIATGSLAATLVVAPDDADVLRLTVSDPTRPFAAIVQRHRAADLQPDAADLAALPNGSLIGLATVTPYRTASKQTLSDLGLSLGEGVVSIEGLPFYRRSDGADASTLLPSHATGALALQSPLD
ncbi:MAG TPA: carboxypeptidase-like regulatory domain-containing protein, partial [Candidatus Acidoferrum sp.]|nr:carboxypeptidase-like regulatory domain-containing protein [Candidatus Acidoferrum sp.]